MSTVNLRHDLILADDNIRLREGAGRGLSIALLGLGALLTVLAVLGAVAGDALTARTALFALHTGFILSVAFPLTALVLVMIFHATNAGWSATIRRQFENIASLIWIAVPFFFGILILQAVLTATKGEGGSIPYLWKWMNAAYVEGDPAFEHKRGYLNYGFFLVRSLIYFAIWIGLSFALNSISRRQDEDGDPKHTITLGRLSCIGLPFLAFSIAFAGFDWLMSLDFHWFSTMYGVYLFASCMVLSVALGTLTLITLSSFGKLAVAFTEEHLHDLAKLLFAFTVFWAYIAFSQYFLIWYANIPEETMFFQVRRAEPWTGLSVAIPIAHFILPFILLLPRPLRRSRGFISFMCVYLIIIQMIETYWMIRPEVYGVGPWHWLDFVGIVGPVAIFLGLFVAKVASGPLIPLKDPRLHEALKHKNHI
ncbi:MAG: quinol:cytochrome C oxidoreductase [Phycisphaeraceae bacterium]|nr:MAG: quinol:cytochrome C oxidoreductase [Phycisphaeraceae bacterium]